METLVRFIERVENRVLYYITEFTKRQDTMPPNTEIWVHQLNGKVVFNEFPDKPNFKRTTAFALCGIGKDLWYMPDKKAIKKWVEEEVLMKSLS